MIDAYLGMNLLRTLYTDLYTNKLQILYHNVPWSDYNPYQMNIGALIKWKKTLIVNKTKPSGIAE